MRTVIFSEHATKCVVASVEAGYTAVAATSILDLGDRLAAEEASIGIISMPTFSGAAEIVRFLRQNNITNLLFMLVNEKDGPVVMGRGRADVLAEGADDCQPSDIDRREMIARLRAMTRRGTKYFDHLQIKFRDCVYRHDIGIITSPRGEFRVQRRRGMILQVLSRRPGAIISKSGLMDAIYGETDDPPEEKIIDVFICQLRRTIIEATGGYDVIRTRWGRGYQFDPNGYLPELNAVRAHPSRQRGGVAA